MSACKTTQAPLPCHANDLQIHFRAAFSIREFFQKLGCGGPVQSSELLPPGRSKGMQRSEFQIQMPCVKTSEAKDWPFRV